jgi:hypothetical protein
LTTQTPAGLLVAALIRRVQGAGGFATVVHRGDADRGAILVQTAEKGRFSGFLERMVDWNGRASMIHCGPAKNSQNIEIDQYISTRLTQDRDLWVLELDIAEAERFAVETIAIN